MAVSILLLVFCVDVSHLQRQHVLVSRPCKSMAPCDSSSQATSSTAAAMALQRHGSNATVCVRVTDLDGDDEAEVALAGLVQHKVQGLPYRLVVYACPATLALSHCLMTKAMCVYELMLEDGSKLSTEEGGGV